MRMPTGAAGAGPVARARLGATLGAGAPGWLPTVGPSPERTLLLTAKASPGVRAPASTDGTSSLAEAGASAETGALPEAGVPPETGAPLAAEALAGAEVLLQTGALAGAGGAGRGGVV